jgi:cytidyltransferase-like protein
MDHKRVLATIFSINLKGEEADDRAVAKVLGLGPSEAREEIESVVALGLAKMTDGRAFLTTKGRKSIKVVFVGGGFEVIHYGHIYTLTKAKSLGDALVVSVARDSTIRRRKNREPLVGEQDRVKMLSALRDVDAAVLGVEGDIYVTLERVKPDIVALGYDQYHMEDEVKKEATKRGMKVDVVRLDSPYPHIKTTRILEEL